MQPRSLRLLPLLLVLLLTMSQACTGEKSSDKESTEEKSVEEKSIDKLPLDAHMEKSYKDDLPGLLQKKYIRVLTTINRTNFYIHDGHLAGHEYSLLKGYEKYLNKKVHKKDLQLVLEFIPVNRDELIPKLKKGYGDIVAAGLSITPERKNKVNFTQPYLTGVDEVLVTGQENFDPESIWDLSGKKLFVRRSSSYYQSLQDLNKRLRNNNRKPVKIVKAPETLETESILEMVNSGAINITVADSHIAKAWSRVLKNIQIHEQVKLRSGSQIAWMVRKNNPKLLNSLNNFLNTHKKGTLLGNIYFNRYFKDVKKLKDPTDKSKWNKMKKYKGLIKKYASKYDFDWLLLLALAFQESGLDNSKRSHAGAVGVMQILPSTAKDKNIGISNITKPENNVHAGTKYLAFLRNRYFSDESIEYRNRVRFTLASYNAGPRKIRLIRKKAEKMGLNPNKWFRNVELAALKVVGQETVRYVSNINKYYNLYKFLLKEN